MLSPRVENVSAPALSERSTAELGESMITCGVLYSRDVAHLKSTVEKGRFMRNTPEFDERLGEKRDA